MIVVRMVAILVVVLVCTSRYTLANEELDKAPRPNILLIVSEDNGQELGCYGEPFVKTPVLDKLAAGGVLFKNAYVPQAGWGKPGGKPGGNRGETGDSHLFHLAK
jgi:hypothetical protein